LIARRVAALATVLTLALAPAAGASSSMADLAGSALLDRHVAGLGGWGWRSAIQAPHVHTDRDVGAGGVAMALLALHDTTHDGAYLRAARRAGDFLLAAAQPSGGGLRWPDYHDPGGVSDTRFTSFDDGAAGIADLMWQLGERTRDARYTRAALAGMEWLRTQARGAAGRRCPELCRWRYYDGADSDYRTGMGEGIAGIAYAFDAFAQRTHDPSYERYATGAAAYLEHVMTPSGAIPEVPGRTGYDTGFLSGDAGQAFLFLTLYAHTGDQRWLHDAQRALAWVRAQAIATRGGLAWPIEVDPGDADDPSRATGIEEGAAGIGWVELQAYGVTHDAAYLGTARRAARWLRGAALHEHGGLAWPEDAGQRVVHTGLNNGAAGIGWYLYDVARVTHSRADAAAARSAAHWLRAVAHRDRRGPYWYEYRDRRGWHVRADPSWHWGSAGIAAFLARLRGWPVDMPGEEPGLL
jgi:hypothetical protein